MLEKSFGATKAVGQITLKSLILRVGDRRTSKMPAHARNWNSLILRVGDRKTSKMHAHARNWNNARACISPNKRQVRGLRKLAKATANTGHLLNFFINQIQAKTVVSKENEIKLNRLK